MAAPPDPAPRLLLAGPSGLPQPKRRKPAPANGQAQAASAFLPLFLSYNGATRVRDYWAPIGGATAGGRVRAHMRGNGPSDPGCDVEQFTQLLAQCQRRVFVYAMSLLHDPNDAEDVLQETNLVLWRKFDEYEPGTDFARWACRVAYYEVLTVRRKNARTKLLFSDEFIETLSADCERTMREWDDRQEALRQCVKKLNDRDRQLLRSRYEPGATTRSVAESSGRSVQGVRKSLLRIRNALAECARRALSSRGHR